MLKPQVHNHQSHFPISLIPLPKPFIHGKNQASFLGQQSSFRLNNKAPINVKVRFNPARNIKAIAGVDAEQSVKVKGVVTVIPTVGGFLTNVGIERGIDDIKDLFGKSILLELVSAELDPKTGQEKIIKAYGHKSSQDNGEVKYESEFEVPGKFGEIGAVYVENEHHTEMYLKDIVLDGFPNGPVTFTCGSWVHSKFDNKQKRVFFTNKSYLPSQTPSALKRLREEELVILRGNGQGERKTGERIYDYDVYNDLGDDEDKVRPVLGGKDHPYPRRCRTGRPRCEKDASFETRSLQFYVPRDEEFAEVKQLTFSAKTLYSALHALLPSLESVLIDSNLGFLLFSDIDQLFSEGVSLPPLQKPGFLQALPRLLKTISEKSDVFLNFETPESMNRDRFFWFRDEEFSRQTLAGLNPYCIQLITEWPLKSKLDPSVYGPPESAITTEIIEREIKGFMTVDEAIQQKKLFIIDYHDMLLPYVSKIRALEGTTLYGSRALFFLTPDGSLKPLAIELVRPPMDDKPQWKEVYTPCWHSTGCWLWRLAKAHFLAHDSGYHQLVSHWLRTHCSTEPYIIATNRQLSVMHPIYRLLHPHFRYTMEINALARQLLINADGIIESSFSPGKYSMEISSVAYDQVWRFDYEALPKDLIRRGVAVEDPTAPHGVRLIIEDYPFANDGLLLWDAIKQWVSEYVNHYYPDPSLIQSDAEIQAWWTEIRTEGHADKKDEPWWPELKTPQDLIEIVTTIVWVTSGHHAAVNFGQYNYAGYFPNRPTIARTKMPTEDPTDEEWKAFLDKPEVQLLRTFPTQLQATKVMTVLDVLSNHSPDEEYLGEYMEAPWGEDPFIKAAFEKLNGRLKEIEGIIDERNANKKFVNRNGAGITPYELLKPFSGPGVTGKGVPYSISI
ncbi:linoleate 13S-lipoxygenase 2-1 chloroplastic-like [Tripterygium wilfordii]|uniref:Lipoxygenase n=1 Tax=Tripterygium wilfordii TaxID=458696 RepID=A0A7J7CNT2_TRIWF|nr:linoleate 13S-lipoxygenase 2-1, chloroplastic-like [Tripterygium wilfordii]KAF5735752.1 linoleate 13S-lipoxygenase 2-1 chloroplastic-like [Tripterygium wilfordii]